MEKINIFTIGVYGSTESEFFNKLQNNGIDTFCDIRRRRGVRGSKYAFVNSKKLQNKLSELGIKYMHLLELAPTNEIRETQRTDDKNKLILKRDRESLSDNFVHLYNSEIISRFEFNLFFENLFNLDSKNVALFCVEAIPAACHRSLLGSYIHKNFNYKIMDL